MSTRWLDTFRGRTVLVTGHTGFKGGWLATWLKMLGAHVVGVALEPEHDRPSLYELGEVARGLESHILDIRDLGAVKRVFERCRPEIVFHLAAQALVRRSYADPVSTYATNLLGTVHVLEAARTTDSVESIVNVTSDKCYENRDWTWGYREIDTLGGHDPYSSSKAGAEILTSAYRSSFFASDASARLASVRAGNTIGGGDWAEDRIVPDVVRAVAAGMAVRVRRPSAVRPWQYVLDPLAGYLRLAADLASADGRRLEGAWNFGPSEGHAVSVVELVRLLAEAWPDRSVRLEAEAGTGPHEARLLRLDASKARQELGWRPRLDLRAAVRTTVEWYDAYLREPASLPRLTEAQIERYASALSEPAGRPTAPHEEEEDAR